MDLDFFVKVIYEMMIIVNRCKYIYKYLFLKDFWVVGG